MIDKISILCTFSGNGWYQSYLIHDHIITMGLCVCYCFLKVFFHFRLVALVSSHISQLDPVQKQALTTTPGFEVAVNQTSGVDHPAWFLKLGSHADTWGNESMTWMRLRRSLPHTRVSGNENEEKKPWLLFLEISLGRMSCFCVASPDGRRDASGTTHQSTTGQTERHTILTLISKGSLSYQLTSNVFFWDCERKTKKNLKRHTHTHTQNWHTLQVDSTQKRPPNLLMVVWPRQNVFHRVEKILSIKMFY